MRKCLRDIKLLIGRYNGGKAAEILGVDYKKIHYIIRHYIDDISLHKAMTLDNYVYLLDKNEKPIAKFNIAKIKKEKVEDLLTCKEETKPELEIDQK